MKSTETRSKLDVYLAMFEAGCLLLLPMTVCPECAGAGVRGTGLPCRNCGRSPFAGWIVERTETGAVAAIGVCPHCGLKKKGVSHRSGGGSAAIPA